MTQEVSFPDCFARAYSPSPIFLAKEIVYKYFQWTLCFADLHLTQIVHQCNQTQELSEQGFCKEGLRLCEVMRKVVRQSGFLEAETQELYAHECRKEVCKEIRGCRA